MPTSPSSPAAAAANAAHAASTTDSAPAAPAVGEAGEKFLVFYLGRDRFALPMSRVRGIVGYVDIAAAPAAPRHVRGTIRLAGREIAVIDVRARFGLPAAPRGADSCIVLVEAGEAKEKAGLIVDGVGEVAWLPAAALEAPPAAKGKDSPLAKSPLVSAVATVGDASPRSVVVVNVDRLAGAPEASATTPPATANAVERTQAA